MRKLHLAIPQYRSSAFSNPSSEINKIPVVNWSVEQVCDWVTSKSFKAYRAVFRDGLVNGQMLLTITPEILATNGIQNMCVGGALFATLGAVCCRFKQYRQVASPGHYGCSSRAEGASREELKRSAS
jgi:hypothetical protein